MEDVMTSLCGIDSLQDARRLLQDFTPSSTLEPLRLIVAADDGIESVKALCPPYAESQGGCTLVTQPSSDLDFLDEEELRERYEGDFIAEQDVQYYPFVAAPPFVPGLVGEPQPRSFDDIDKSDDCGIEDSDLSHFRNCGDNPPVFPYLNSAFKKPLLCLGLARDSYFTTVEALCWFSKADESGWPGRTVVSIQGPPGIGKSLFGFFLIHLLRTIVPKLGSRVRFAPGSKTLHPLMDVATSREIVEELPKRVLVVKKAILRGYTSWLFDASEQPRKRRKILSEEAASLPPDLLFHCEKDGWQCTGVDFEEVLGDWLIHRTERRLKTWVIFEDKILYERISDLAITDVLFIFTASDTLMAQVRGKKIPKTTRNTKAYITLPTWSYAEWMMAMKRVCGRHCDGTLMYPEGFNCCLASLTYKDFAADLRMSLAHFGARFASKAKLLRDFKTVSDELTALRLSAVESDQPLRAPSLERFLTEVAEEAAKITSDSDTFLLRHQNFHIDVGASIWARGYRHPCIHLGRWVRYTDYDAARVRDIMGPHGLSTDPVVVRTWLRVFDRIVRHLSRLQWAFGDTCLTRLNQINSVFQGTVYEATCVEWLVHKSERPPFVFELDLYQRYDRAGVPTIPYGEDVSSRLQVTFNTAPKEYKWEMNSTVLTTYDGDESYLIRPKHLNNVGWDVGVIANISEMLEEGYGEACGALLLLQFTCAKRHHPIFTTVQSRNEHALVSRALSHGLRVYLAFIHEDGPNKFKMSAPRPKELPVHYEARWMLEHMRRQDPPSPTCAGCNVHTDRRRREKWDGRTDVERRLWLLDWNGDDFVH